MHTALMVILAIVSVFLIISVLLQVRKIVNGLSGSIARWRRAAFSERRRVQDMTCF